MRKPTSSTIWWSRLKWIGGTLSLIVSWVVVAVFGGLQGWWLEPVAPAGDAAAFHAWAQAEIEQAAPGAAALLILEEEAVVARAFTAGHNENTLFPAASLSKFVAALAVHALAKTGHVDLDAPVSSYLTWWQLPPTKFDPDQVTLRRLLSHTAGFTDRLGFGDYASDESVPNLEDSLAHPRASGGRPATIVQGQAAGSFLYSGGSYLILELIVKERSGQSYAEYVEASVFQVAGMTRSTYQHPDKTTANVAPLYDAAGSPLPWFRYASAAATGLATSAADLARLAVHASEVKSLREPTAFAMGAPIWGPGAILYAPAGDDFVFGHDGANDPGINSSIRINPVTEDALVMLVSGHPNLATHIGSAWVLWQTGTPDVLALEQALRSAILPAAAGSILIILLVAGIKRTRAKRAWSA
jgi:CubicO group peptidase (beta-lactamase class C family)